MVRCSNGALLLRSENVFLVWVAKFRKTRFSDCRRVLQVFPKISLRCKKYPRCNVFDLILDSVWCLVVMLCGWMHIHPQTSKTTLTTNFKPSHNCCPFNFVLQRAFAILKFPEFGVCFCCFRFRAKTQAISAHISLQNVVKNVKKNLLWGKLQEHAYRFSL